MKTTGFKANLSDEEEKTVRSWVKENREKNKQIRTKSLLAYECSINNLLGLKKYNAQIELVYRFIKRNSLSIRRVTHLGQTSMK